MKKLRWWDQIPIICKRYSPPLDAFPSLEQKDCAVMSVHTYYGDTKLHYSSEKLGLNLTSQQGLSVLVILNYLLARYTSA